MIKNRVIITPTTVPIDNICDYQFQTAKVLAKKNLVIMYLLNEGHSLKELFFQKKISIHHTTDGIHYLSPLYILPFRRFAAIEKLNKQINFFFLRYFLTFKAHLYNHRPILWVYHPYLYPYFKYFPQTQFFWLYDIVDYHSDPDDQKRKQLHRQEDTIIKQADLVVANSKTLFDHFKKKATNIHQVPLGFREADFTQRQTKTIILPSSKPTIGLVGHINNRIDFKILNSLIKNNPQWQFIFVGPVSHDPTISHRSCKKQIHQLLKHDNVTWYDHQPRSHMKGIIEQFDVAMIPYDITFEFNKFCFPMKVMEYFYLEKPVISTDIKELEHYPDYVKIGSTAKQWETHIKSILNNPWKHKRNQIQIAQQHTWKNKLTHISKHITQTEATA